MKKILLNKKFHAFLMLIFLAVSVQYSESESRWRLALRHFNFDYYNIFKPYELAGHAIIVDVDDKSLAHHSLGQWPWPRTKLAALVTALDELGARAIVFDMVFSEVDRTSPQMMLKLLDEDDDSFQSMKSIITNLPDNDQVFADAIKKAGNVVTGFTYNYGESRNPPRLISKITASTIPRGQRVSDFVKEYEALAGNLSVISRHAKGNGCFFSSVDPDGIVRRVPHFATYSRHEGEISIVYPSLSLEAFRVAHKWSGYDLLLEDSYFQKGLVKPSIETSGGEGVTLVNKAVPFKMLRDTTIPKPDKYIPLTDEANFLVYFADINQANMDQWYISALDVFRGNVDPSRIKGKVVFIGTSAAGLKDLRNTPLAGFRPGVEIHMNIYDQMKERVFLYRPNWAKGAEILFMSVFGFIIIFISPFASAFSLYFLLVSAITSGAFFGWHLFVQDGYLIDVLYPILVTFFILIINTILSYIRAEVDKKQIGDTLGMYVSPAYIEELAKKPENLKLGGETKELSVMFTDIRNFTSISESLTPEELIRLMNGFLTPMSDLVMSNHGTIDKYMGDAMMAFWNAPLDDPNHARNSCLTLLEMNKALKPLNDSLREKAENMGIKPILLEAGVGLNSGPASVGNMGSKQRFAYSALGDAVNLASRLEGQTKTYGVKNLVGENTQMQVRDFAFLELDLIRVKGKEEPVKIFTLLGDEKLAEHQEFRRWRETHNEMIETYRAAKFEKAADIINKCKEASEGNLSKYYDLILLRIGEFFANPPPKDWDGVYVAKTK